MKENIQEFKIDVDNIHWIDYDVKNTTDLCAHGHVYLRIGSHACEYENATVSATSLYLLKTLSRNHLAYTENQLVPCCGHLLLPKAPDKFGEICDICGCPNGIDWTVKHKENSVLLVLDEDKSFSISFEQYKSEVFSFSDKVKIFYKSNLPRDDSEEFEKGGWKAFYEEWQMHYKKWNYSF